MLEIREISVRQRLGLLDLEVFRSTCGAVSNRELELRGSRYTISQLLGTESYSLAYTSSRKPYLEGRSERLSISHSHGKLAVLISQHEEAGVDVELLRDKVLAIREKFLSAEELAYCGSDVERHVTFWAVKEAIYKTHGAGQLDFRRDMKVIPVSASELRCSLETGNGECRSFSLRKERIGGHVLVFVLHEIPAAHQKA